MLNRLRLVPVLAVVLGLLAGAMPAAADTTAQSLPFAQDWTNIGLITANDDWSGVPGIVGYLGDDPSTTTSGVDPQTRLEASWSATVDVIANQVNPGISNGGVAEFDLPNPTVALQGSGTADAPNLVLSLDTSGKTGIVVAYNLRDIDGSADHAVQQVALQFRTGSSGNFTNVPAGYVADATTGPNLATRVTPVNVTLPPTADDQPLVQVRVVTTNAAGNDEWVGVDDISVVGGDEPPPDVAPFVASTSPPSDASEVPTNSNVEITFSEPVSVTTATFSISCSTSGVHPFALSGAATTYTLNPDTDFANGETCTVTVDDAGVSDTDTVDPPDKMAADYIFSFTTTGLALRIHDIQGAQHRSPYEGALVSQVPGVVIATSSSGFWFQDPQPDATVATSEGVFVFTGAPPAFTVGTAVLVNGRVTEFRPGCPPATCTGGSAFDNLTTTEIDRASVTPAGPGAITPTVVGAGGRRPPTEIIDNDSAGQVEDNPPALFDPAQDGVDFYESLEGMLVRVNNPVAVGPTAIFGTGAAQNSEIPVLADNGAGAGLRTPRGGIMVRKLGSAPPPDEYAHGDFNPERIILGDAGRSLRLPFVDVRDRLTPHVDAVVDYSFANYKFFVLNQPTVVSGGLQRELTQAPRSNELAIATFNVENLDPSDVAAIPRLAAIVVDNMRSPDLIGIEEMQDNTGSDNDGTTAANLSWQAFIDAIVAAGGPRYHYRQIDPVNNQDGGQQGGNIRVGFLFRTDRGLRFVDRGAGNATTPTAVYRQDGGAHLTLSPGRVDPLNPAWAATRKPLAGEFVWNDKTLIVIANHFSSKGGDDPLFGRFQSPIRSSEVARHRQAASVNAFVDTILAAERKANVVVLGDINDFEFSETTQILVAGGVLNSLMETLPKPERYSYVFEGNSQVLDQILFSQNMLRGLDAYDVVHVNSEFADQASDHEPSVAITKVLGGGGGGGGGG